MPICVVHVKETLEQRFFTSLFGGVGPQWDQEICQTLFVLWSMMRQLKQRREWWKRQLERVVDVSILPRQWSVFFGYVTAIPTYGAGENSIQGPYICLYIFFEISQTQITYPGK